MSAVRACAEPGCTGEIAADGYCDTCGAKARPPSRPAPGARQAAPAAAPPDAAPAPARRLGAARPSSPGPGPGPADGGSAAVSGGTHVSGSSRSPGSRRQTRATRSSASRRTAIGAGLVDVPPAPPVDPSAVVLKDPEVAENKRFCSNCGAPVGRSRDGAPGRTSGFCPACRNPFDFVPKLRRGEIVGRQYEVMGCLAHGGLGWIYLARDKAVNDRWVVLKGLLDSGDQAAMAVAVAERRFLAELDHPAIVVIYNFITDRGAGYIVMEYIGGRSLKQILAVRRAANGGDPDPLPVDQAIAFVLAIIPASPTSTAGACSTATSSPTTCSRWATRCASSTWGRCAASTTPPPRSTARWDSRRPRSPTWARRWRPTCTPSAAPWPCSPSTSGATRASSSTSCPTPPTTRCWPSSTRSTACCSRPPPTTPTTASRRRPSWGSR